ncbi:MAG: RNA polymerase sporulation sigma factor SigG [Lachnospira sp.]
MAGYKVEICGVNTRELPLLSTQEKTELLKLTKQGDKNARDRFIKGNLRLVLSIVGRFNQSNENIDDLFQIGCIGMIKAIDNFDISQGVQFSTYAVPMIIGEIKRYLRDNSTIRVSRSLKDTAYKAIYAKEKYISTHQKEPSIAEIAEEIGVPGEDIVMALEAVSPTVSLYEPVYNDGGDTLYVIDQVKDKKNREENWVTHLALVDAMQKLNPKEKEIITMRYFDSKTQMEVANEIGISQAQVSRLEKCALKKLKKHII